MQPGRVGTARVVVLTILTEELLAARAVLGANNEILGTGCYRDGADFDVVVAKASDRGNAVALGAARDLVEDYRPELLIVAGIAGGIKDREDVQPGDVVAVDYVHYAEFRKIV